MPVVFSSLSGQGIQCDKVGAHNWERTSAFTIEAEKGLQQGLIVNLAVYTRYWRKDNLPLTGCYPMPGKRSRSH